MSFVIDAALVGTGGMMPLPNRWLSSVLLRYAGHLILFDCGEGTQISLRSLGWGIKDIDLILISHVHGDHVTGLPGLLLTQGNSERTEQLQIVEALIQHLAFQRNTVDGLHRLAHDLAPWVPRLERAQEAEQRRHLGIAHWYGRHSLRGNDTDSENYQVGLRPGTA